MAETHPKRHRDDDPQNDNPDGPKRHKQYTEILSILEQDEDEPTQDFSSIFSTFEQELDPTRDYETVLGAEGQVSELDPFDPTREPDPDLEDLMASAVSGFGPGVGAEDEKDGVIKRLLEASDDELGIPNAAGDIDEINGCDSSSRNFCGGDGMWEFEDEAANYYALLQSELFM